MKNLILAFYPKQEMNYFDKQKTKFFLFQAYIGLLIIAISSIQELISPGNNFIASFSSKITMMLFITIALFILKKKGIKVAGNIYSLVTVIILVIWINILTENTTPFYKYLQGFYSVFALLVIGILFASRWIIIINAILIFAATTRVFIIAKTQLPEDADLFTAGYIAHTTTLIFVTTILYFAHRYAEFAIKKAEENESKFKQLSDLTFEGILLHNKGIVIDMNMSLIKLTGYSKNEMLGKNIIELLVPENFKGIIFENIKKNYALPYEIEAVKKDGSVIPVEVEAKDIETNTGEIIRVVAIRDITNRKQAEEKIRKLSTAVMQSSNTIVITGTDGSIEYVNPAFTKISGYTADEAFGQNPRILNSGIQPREYYAEMWNRITKGEIWRGEFCNKTKLGRMFWENVTITPIKNDRHEIINYLAIKEDITERKKAELEIEQKNKELIIAKEKAEESNKLKTEFLQNMSHEIRTPMNSILGFSEFLSDSDISSEKHNNYVNIIQKSGIQLLHIIDDVLEISKLETQKVRVIEEEVCLNNLLFEQFSFFDIKAKDKKIALYLKEGLLDKESTMLTDRTKLNKILGNLLDNAIKYTNEGFVEYGYQLKTDTESDEIEIYISDTGIGIESEEQVAIFNRFSQEYRELTRSVGGLGLGLSIAKENAELLGGKISVQSEKGKGSTFFVTIPYKPCFTEADNKKPGDINDTARGETS